MSVSITSIAGLSVGHWTDREAATGCTVVLCPEGAVASVDVRGGAPGTRETDLLRAGTLVERVHAVLLSGGSAYGLDAATGVMRWLEERGHGFPVPSGVVPIVPAAILIDLSIGDPKVRPDADAGYAACEAASGDALEEGCVGAGTGATVAKALGMEGALKGGIGSAAETDGIRRHGSGADCREQLRGGGGRRQRARGRRPAGRDCRVVRVDAGGAESASAAFAVHRFAVEQHDRRGRDGRTADEG